MSSAYIVLLAGICAGLEVGMAIHSRHWFNRCSHAVLALMAVVIGLWQGGVF